MRTILNNTFCFAILLLSIIYFSCAEKKSNDLLQQAQAIVESDPQKALILLDSIPNPQDMDKDSYMQYIVAHVQAKYKCYKDISNDTLIFVAQQYFEKKNNLIEATLAHYNAGDVYYEKDMPDMAMECYLQAKNCVSKTDNNLLTGRISDNIGYLYFKQGMQDSAIVYFKNALYRYEKDSKTSNHQLNTIVLLGRSFLANNNIDSASYNFDKGLTLAIQSNDKYYQSAFKNNQGVIFRKKKKYNEAINCFQEALECNINTEDSLRNYFNLALVYNSTYQVDSTKHYTNLLKNRIQEIKYKPTLRLVYYFLYKFNEQTGNYKEAAHYKTLHSEIDKQIQKSDFSEQLNEAHAKYMLRLNEEALARQKLWTYGIGIVAFLVFVIMSLHHGYKKRKYKLNNELLYNQKIKFELENELLQQKTANLETALNAYQDILDSRKEILDDINYEPIEKKKLEGLFDKVRNNTNTLFVEWSKNNLKNHPCSQKIMLSLSNEELRIMHLSFFEYPYENIAEMLGFKYEEGDMEYRIRTIRNKLLSAGVTAKEVDLILKKADEVKMNP